MRSPVFAVRRLVCVFATLGAAVALGQTPSLPGSGSPVPPRVFVILDTSNSMSHRPDYNTNPWDDATVVGDDTSTDPLNAQTPDATCRNKFCIAKKTVFSVLNQYVASDIRLALASYYQYLIKYDPVDTRQSQCWYDVMWKPGQTLYYPKDSSYGFNQDTRLSAPLTGYELSGAANSNHQNCVANTYSKYDLNEQTTANPVPSICNVYNQLLDPSPTLTTSGVVPTQTGCITSKAYSVTSYSNLDNLSGGYYHYRIAAASSCPVAVPTSADYTSAVSLKVDTGTNNTLCNAGSTNVPCWENSANKPWTSTVGDSCSTGYPCKMYSASSGAETPVNTKSEWFGFFGGTCSNPAAGTESSTDVTKCAQVALGSNNSSFYTAGRLDSVPTTITYTDTANTNNCNGLTLSTATRVTSGNLYGTNGYAGANLAAVNSAVTSAVGGVSAGYTLVVPPQAACATGWPCDVTLQTNTTNALAWGSWSAAQNACTPVAGAVQCQSTTSKAVQLLMTGAMCPSFSTSTANPVSGTNAVDWITSPACGTGNAACTFNGGPTSVGGTIPSCTTPVQKWAPGAPANCTIGSITRSYSGGAATAVNVWVTQTRLPATCTATLATASFQAAVGADTTALTACRATGSCPVSSGTPSVSTSKEYISSTTSTTMPGGAWSPVVTSACAGDNCTADQPIAGSYLWYAPTDASGCSGYTNNSVYTIGGSLGTFIQGTGVTGSSINGYNADSTPRYQCKFQAFTRVWERFMTKCSYTITPYNWTVNNAITYCNYTIEQKQQQVPLPTTYTCKYQVAARKFDLTLPQYKVCNYYRTATQLKRNLTLYRYTYTTKGGELVGSNPVSVPGDQCNVAVPYANFSGTCPPTLDNCKGTGTMCYLRTAASNAPTYSTDPVSAAASGRLINVSGAAFTVTNAGTATATTNTLGASAGKSCVINDWSSPPVTEPTRASYCANNGAAVPVSKYKLVSDYLSCTDPSDPTSCAANDINRVDGSAGPPVIPADPRTDPALSLKPGFATGLAGTYNKLTNTNWTNANTKAYGMSGSGAGYTTPSQLFMDFPPDNGDNSTAFKNMLSKCTKPSSANVTWPNWSHQGLCMADTGSVNTATCNGGDVCSDFTPLYGSLSNAYQYLKGQLAADSNNSCRKYVVVLATDGSENTPANYTPTQLNNAVSALRTLSAGAVTKDVQTYVLGFGDLVADATNAAHLNDMAAAGNTGSAYFASDQATLRTQLSSVFSNILSGVYSRSKPVISTDGTTVYSSYFTRGSALADGGVASTPEWQGSMAAWGIASGALTLRWELGDKLNNKMLDSDRTLYTDVSGARQNFTVANAATVAPLLNTDTGYPGGPGTTATLDPLKVLKFVRNSAKVTGTPNTGEAFFGANTVLPRQSRLNAIVQAAPVPVGKSVNTPEWGGLTGSASRTSYGTFQLNTTNRETQVLVGASDGMLRGIRENVDPVANPSCATNEASASCPTGKENWGWVPSLKQSTLYLEMSGYSPGVDGQSAVEDVCADDDANGDAKNCSVGNWKTIAITGLRTGGRGVFALDVTNPANPKYLWSFSKTPSQDQLGYPQSPIIGRVEVSGKDQFVAVLPSGTRWNGINGTLNQSNSDEVYVFNALTGQQIDWYNASGCWWCGFGNNQLDMTDQVWNEDNQFVARASYFRRSGSPYMDAAMLSGTAGVLYEMRFRKPPVVTVSGGVTTITSNAETNTNKWEPQVFFDPTDSDTSKDPLGHAVKVRRVVEADAGVYTQPECAGLAGGSTCGALPISRRLPIFQRPRLSNVYDTSGLAPDYYVGTGDALHPDSPKLNSGDPTNPSGGFIYNYFYAVHDGASVSNGRHDGQPLWVNQFIDKNEQVVSEPAMVAGSLIVGTYTPPTDACNAAGDVTFYCFDPKAGDLRNCLVAADGSKTAVMKFPNVGIPSDPVVVNQKMYWMSSTAATGGTPGDPPKPNAQGVAPIVSLGDTRSFKRVR